MKNIFITGGLGYIGSHTCVVLLEAGFQVSIIDNLCNSNPGVLDRIECITGVRPVFYRGDIRDRPLLDDIFSKQSFDAVIHFAGLKAVGESVEKPVDYYDNNVNGSLSLFIAMKKVKLQTLVFSSSATVYGDPHSLPITEDFPCSATNPYGGSKLMVENILSDLAVAEPGWSIGRLRYFNPVGAHAGGLIGEDPKGVPNNLMPYIAQVASGRRNKLQVFGGDYPTPDGSGVRDYIHVMDLAEGHLAALRYCQINNGLLTVNLGTGQGISVIQMIETFERVTGQKVAFEIVGRRPGDIAQCWTDPTLAKQLLGWSAGRSIEDMCTDAWRWQDLNPSGYDEG
ncbi:MAG: UDP-glucose 4-epimerase GalE [Gammaproteobacteria bacterium]|nr:UDP-glucose 4-epimerase GalE [Gammaproteobacteria bacterium]